MCKNPDAKQGAIRVYSNLKGLITFKTIWREIARCFGMVFKREQLSKPHDEVTMHTVLSGFEELKEPSASFQRLIFSIRALFSCHQLDISHG